MNRRNFFAALAAFAIAPKRSFSDARVGAIGDMRIKNNAAREALGLRKQARLGVGLSEREIYDATTSLYQDVVNKHPELLSIYQAAGYDVKPPVAGTA